MLYLHQWNNCLNKWNTCRLTIKQERPELWTFCVHSFIFLVCIWKHWGLIPCSSNNPVKGVPFWWRFSEIGKVAGEFLALSSLVIDQKDKAAIPISHPVFQTEKVVYWSQLFKPFFLFASRGVCSWPSLLPSNEMDSMIQSNIMIASLMARALS